MIVRHHCLLLCTIPVCSLRKCLLKTFRFNVHLDQFFKKRSNIIHHRYRITLAQQPIVLCIIVLSRNVCILVVLLRRTLRLCNGCLRVFEIVQVYILKPEKCIIYIRQCVYKVVMRARR